MPHFIVEYSNNVEKIVDLAHLANEIRDVAVSTGVFPLGGIRVRMHPCAIYTIANGHPDAAFVHIMLRMGAGRDLPTRREAATTVFNHLETFFSALFSALPFALSFEVCEIDAELSFKKNSIHKFLENST